MKRTINIAIVAFGRIAKTHILASYMANIKLNLPFELKVTHIITSRPEAIPFRDICVCKSLKEALERENSIDIVDICNINEAHYIDIKEAIKHHKAIYCEKPLTDSLQKSKDICTLIASNNLFNGVPLIFRYLPCVHMLKEQLKQKELGEVICFEARYYHCGYLDEDKRNTWRTKQTSGGGASIDLGIHMMDIIQFIFGKPHAIENTYSSYFPDVETDEIYRSIITLDDKRSGEIVASRIYSQKTQNIYIEVFCEKGSYLCRIDDPYILKKTEFRGNVTEMKPSRDSSFMRYMVEESEATSYHLDAHMCCLADFARQVYGIEYGQYIASFQEAFQSQIAISANML